MASNQLKRINRSNPVAHVTIGDVAREAGVALGTVSNVLNHPEKVRPETIAQVQEAIDRLGYAPNQSARVLAGGSNRTFGLVLPRLDHGFYLQIATGATSQATKEGYSLLIASCAGDNSRTAGFRSYFAGTQMSGMLVVASLPELGIFVANPPIPTVYLNANSERNGYFVAADAVAEGRLITEHLIERGAERILVVGHPATPKLRARAEGVRGLETLYPHVDFDYLEEGSTTKPAEGVSIAKKIAQMEPELRPDGIIALSDLLASGVIAGLQAEGIRVPEDMLVAGCDGNPLAWSGAVSLTTCAPTGYEIGRRGVKMLIEQVELAKTDPAEARRQAAQHHETLVKPFLLARSSSNPAGTVAENPVHLDLGLYL